VDSREQPGECRHVFLTGQAGPKTEVDPVTKPYMVVGERVTSTLRVKKCSIR